MDRRQMAGDGCGAFIEQLEPRLLLAADVVISEIMYQDLTDIEIGLPEDPGEEFIELYNRGDAPADLLDWEIANGVDFVFPDVTLGAGEYLIVPANPAVFATKHPGVTNFIDAGWTGRLSNSGETIEIVDSLGVTVDQVAYADEGDWAVRQWVPDIASTFGYAWSNFHDGGGYSLELINPALTNNSGHNWSASLTLGGTPGAVNSVFSTDIAPMIRNVEHYPIIPTAGDEVTVIAKVQDELTTGLTVVVRYRDDGDPAFNTAVMYDDGLHDDEDPGDGIYATQLPARSDGTIVEFYIQATDANANTRNWPAPVTDKGQTANLLYQVDDTFTGDWTPGDQPQWRVILTAQEWAELDLIEDTSTTRRSNAQRNATWIAIDGTGVDVRYQTGMRNRGNGSRSTDPHNQRINIPHDTPWQGVQAVTINARVPQSQSIGSAVFRFADIPAIDTTPIEFRINGVNYATGGMYHMYNWLEALDSDMAANHWPDDPSGHLYKNNDSNGDGDGGDFDYSGEDPDNYNVAYVKQTNVATGDYSGLIHMLDVLNNAPVETYMQDVAEVVDIEQWIRFLAVDTLLANGEGGLTSGRGDDYAMYQGVIDPRFTLVPYDLDTVLGTGSQSRIDDDIWDYRDPGLHGLNRLLSQPEAIQMYYATLLELCDTVFSPEQLHPLIDEVLGGWVSSAEVDDIKQFAAARVANVRGQVANAQLSVQSTLPVVGGYARSSIDTAVLSGTASGAYVKSVLVNGEAADWDLETGVWGIGSGGSAGGTISFQNGVNGYTGTVDTEIRTSNPTGDLSGADSINIDGVDSGGSVQALLRFDDIFGSGPGRIAPGATILNATLTLNVTNTGGLTTMHRMVMPWAETDNWNTFGDGVDANGTEAAVAVDATPDFGNSGDRVVDVTQAILAWQAGAETNYGWAFLSTDSNGTDIESSEAASTGNRPELIITIDDSGGDPETGGASLAPGLNRLVVEAFDGPAGTGHVLDSTYIDVWYDTGPTNIYPQATGGGGGVTAPVSTHLTVRDSYLPGVPVLVRVEALDASGDICRDLWDATAILSADNGVQMDVSAITMYNGLGTALITFTGGTGDFNLTATVGALQDTDDLRDMTGDAVTIVSGTLSDVSGTDTWSGIIHVTGDVLVPTGHTLNIDAGTLVLLDGDPTPRSTVGVDIDVQGTINSLGSEDQPVSFTAFVDGAPWGEFHHDNASPSLYHYTHITQGGHSPGGGHTGHGPVFRPADSTIVFDYVTISDNRGKVMQSSGGSDITFLDSVMARSVSGPEIDNTALLMEDTFITQMWGVYREDGTTDDDDGIYIHGQAAGQNVTLRRGVIADTDDDGLDTLHATVVVEDYIFRDMFDKGSSVFGGNVTFDGIISANNDIGISAKDGSHAEVHIDHATITGNTWGIQAENKGGGMDNGVIEYFITNSIIYGNSEWAVRSDYALDPIIIDYSIVGPNWISDGGYRGVPDEPHTGEVWPGTSNQNADPLFASPATGSYHLQAGSPALLAGADGKDLGYYGDAGPVIPPDGELSGDTIWRPEDGQYRIAGNLTVPAAYTLTIMPGTTVFFGQGAQLIVEGRLVAEGLPEANIHFAPASTATGWEGVHFVNTTADNRITHAVIRGSTRTDGMIDVDNSRLTIEDSVFEDAGRRRITATDSSLVVRNSTFADFEFSGTPANNVLEHLWGRNVMPGGELILEGNVFGATPGHNDAVDFDAGHRLDGDPVPQVINNVFTGGGDDALDIEGDFYVQGNTFMHYRKDAWHDAVDGGESNVISAGDSPDDGHHYVVTGNTFYDADHVAIIKEGSFMTFTNNTVVGVSQGQYAALPGALFFDLAGQVDSAGEGAYLDGNIFVDTPVVFSNLDTRGGITDLTVNRSILPTAEHHGGVGNIDADARLADPAGGDFSLKPGSPAIGSGPVGIDMGADVPAGAAVSPVPLGLTHLTSATFDVSGDADYRHAPFLAYKYRLNGGAWSAEQTPGTQISLTGLTDGPQLLEVISQNFAGVWQDEADAAARLWMVDATLSRVLINEVLATNRTVHPHDLRTPDVIELYNDSESATIDISGWSISDNADLPTKYVFGPGTTIAPDSYLVLYAAIADVGATGTYLGFQLDGDGDDLYLYDQTQTLVDSIEYGLQIPDLSIGRTGPDRQWTLNQPSIGGANIAQPTADPDMVLINEWFANGDEVLIDDFIELHNPDTLPADLSGLHVTDNPANQKTKHQIAPLSFIGAEGFVALTADNRNDAGHVDFALRANMEILGLFDADVNQMDRVYFGPQTEDVSHGHTPDGGANTDYFTLPTPGVGNVAMGIDEIVMAESNARYALIPDVGTTTTWPAVDFATWPGVGFDTIGWTYWDGSPYGVGFDSGDGAYTPLIGVDVIAMDDVNSSCYIAYPFNYAGNPNELTSLSLDIRYDDGFIAYLNGQEIRRETFDAGAVPAWDSFANDIHDDALALGLVSIDITAHKGLLNAGANVLAIHGLNESNSSSDFLISAQLSGTASGPFANLLAVHNDLRITEIMYNPSGSDDKEFIEFQNTGSSVLNLEGVRITDGVDFVFPAMTLDPGQYVVVAGNLIEFNDFYNDPSINVIGDYVGSLSNAGEDILLQMPDPYEAAILRFDYNDNWYPATDGDGASLVIVDPLGRRGDWDPAEGWMPSSVTGGSPGVIDPTPDLPIGAVVVNEMLAHSDGGVEDWIELHNTTGDDIDISGWFLSDDPASLEKFVIPGDPSTPFEPGNTILPAGGYVAFNELNDFTGLFALSEHGDDIVLSSCDVAGELSTYRAFVSFDATENGVTLGRHTLSTGEVDFVAMETPTYEGANSAPLVGPMIIEEIMYNPEGPGGTEYILMKNISGSAVNLFDPANPTSTWRISGGVDFVFPQGVTVQPGEFVLITSVDAATYLASHTVGAGVEVLGPFDLGALSNGGDTITVSRPGNPETVPVAFTPYIPTEIVKYNDSLPWPEAPDGDGPALSKLQGSLDQYGNDPVYWGASGGPTITIDSLTTDDQTPEITGSATDVHPPAEVTVTVDGTDYVVPVVAGVWTLPDNTITTPLAGGLHDVSVSAIDSVVGNVGVDATTDELFIDIATQGGVVARHVFYNNSAWDGSSDDDAIDPSKTPLLPGGVATAANYTGYSRGINGIMVDIDTLTADPTAGDFTFNVNQAATPDTWAPAPAPASITRTTGAGVSGSDRVTITWADGEIVDQWIEVTVLATGVTGLGSADVFYFGNAAGDIDGDGAVDDSDYSTLVSQFGLRGAQGTLAADVDQDGRVGLKDFAAVRSRFGRQGVLAPTPPALAPPAAAAPIEAVASPAPDAGGASVIGDSFDFEAPQLSVDLFVELQSPASGAGEPVVLAATDEAELRPLSDEAPADEADLLTDILAESMLAMPL